MRWRDLGSSYVFPAARLQSSLSAVDGASNTVRLQGERLSRDPSGAAAQIDGNEWPIGQLRQSVVAFSII